MERLTEKLDELFDGKNDKCIEWNNNIKENFYDKRRTFSLLNNIIIQFQMLCNLIEKFFGLIFRFTLKANPTGFIQSQPSNQHIYLKKKILSNFRYSFFSCFFLL